MHTRHDRSNLEGPTSGTRSSSAASFRPRTRLIWCLISLFALLALHLAGCRTLGPLPDGGGSEMPEIDIQFVNGGGSEPLIQPASGWPLTLSLTANEEKRMGIGLCCGEGEGKDKGYPALNPPSETFLAFEDPETRVHFIPGLHVEKAGYGSNPRLPNLVVVADADERNLAGWFQSVAYELKDARGRTSILAHMNVPRGLFLAAGEEELLSAVGKVVTIRAFVVGGDPLEKLPDANGDGIVDIADARRKGLRLLSEQATLRVQPWPAASGGCHRGDPGTIENPPR